MRNVEILQTENLSVDTPEKEKILPETRDLLSFIISSFEVSQGDQHAQNQIIAYLFNDKKRGLEKILPQEKRARILNEFTQAYTTAIDRFFGAPSRQAEHGKVNTKRMTILEVNRIVIDKVNELIESYPSARGKKARLFSLCEHFIRLDERWLITLEGRGFDTPSGDPYFSYFKHYVLDQQPYRNAVYDKFFNDLFQHIRGFYLGEVDRRDNPSLWRKARLLLSSETRSEDFRFEVSRRKLKKVLEAYEKHHPEKT
jgi:hypothetical protein